MKTGNIVLLGICAFLVGGCGTIIANPADKTVNAPGPSDATSPQADEQNEAPDPEADLSAATASEQLLDGACDKIEDCFGQTYRENCETTLPTMEAGAKFGDTANSTFDSLEAQQQDDSLEVDADSLADCLAAIEALTCEASAIAGYSTESPDDFSQFIAIFDQSSCATIYQD